MLEGRKGRDNVGGQCHFDVILSAEMSADIAGRQAMRGPNPNCHGVPHRPTRSYLSVQIGVTT